MIFIHNLHMNVYSFIAEIWQLEISFHREIKKLMYIHVMESYSVLKHMNYQIVDIHGRISVA